MGEVVGTIVVAEAGGGAVVVNLDPLRWARQAVPHWDSEVGHEPVVDDVAIGGCVERLLVL